MTRTRTALTALIILALTVGAATQAQAAPGRHGDGAGRGPGADRSPGVRPSWPSGGGPGHGPWRPHVLPLRRHTGFIPPIVGLLRSMWVSRGHWETRTRQVLAEPAHWEIRTAPAVYELRRGPYGRLIRVCVQPARTYRVWVPARYEYVTERVWVSY